MRRAGAHLKNNVVAYLALFIALGGTSAWAAEKITSKQLAANAVRSKHIKDGQVTGADVNESTLAQVPSAVSATSAVSAANASALDGITASSFVKKADPITGGNLTGTYASPVIAPNAVSGTKVADGSLTIADIALKAGSFSVDLPNLAAGACNFIGASAIGSVTGGKLFLINPDDSFGAYGFSSPLSVESVGFDGAHAPVAKVCNYTSGAINPANATFTYAVLG